MSGVVLRCPHCGTTQGAPGECEACHEAEVRYYCSNHTPGRWVDQPSCPHCGARFGEPARPKPPPPKPDPRRPQPVPERPAPPPRIDPIPTPRPRAPVDVEIKRKKEKKERFRLPTIRRRKRPRDDEEVEWREDRYGPMPGPWDPGPWGPDPRGPEPWDPRNPWERDEGPAMPAPIGMALGGCLRLVIVLFLFLLFGLIALSSLIGNVVIHFP